eukprot:gene11537-13410_t
MYHLMYNTSINNNTNNLSLNFVSSIGYRDSSVALSSTKGALLEQSLLGFRDLVVVLRAYAEAEVTAPLIVHSVDTNNGDSNIALNSSLGEATIVAPVALDTKLVKALSRQLLGLMLIFNSDASPVAAFAQALQQLNTTLTSFYNTSYIMGPTDWRPMRAALLDLLILHFGEESSKFVHACQNQQAGTAPVTYLCAHSEARRQLGDTVLAHISVNRDGNVDRSLVEKTIANMVSKLVNVSPAITTTAPSVKANPQSISILVAADVFVFIFVRPEQVPYAQKLVFHWQRHGVLKTKINQLTSVKDVVYVLIGLQAALAFPQPGRLLGPDEDELVALCTVPSVPYGWSKHLRLPAKITISAKTSTTMSTNNNNGNELPWDFTAMVGIGYKLLDMIKAVTTYSDVNNNVEDSNDSITTYALQQRLQSYAQANPLEVTLDCAQNVFYSTKATILQQMLVNHYEQHSVSYNNMPILRDVVNQPAGNDTIMAVAIALGITFSDDHGHQITSIKPSITESYDNKKYYDMGNVYAYRQYRSAVNRLLSAYLDDTNDYYDFKQVISGNMEHAEVVLPLVKLNLLPFPRNYLNKTRIPRDQKHKCYLELDSYKIVNDHIFKAVYLPNHLTSTVLSIINLVHQVVVCECEDLRYSMDEAVYHFVRIGLLGKYVTAHMPPNEYKLTAALLENYESFLLAVFTNINTRDEHSVYNNPYSSTYYTRTTDNTNSMYGNLLDNKDVFTSNVVALYNYLSTYYKNQLLVTVRYALIGVRIENGVYPAMAHTLQRTYQVQTFQEVKQGRLAWHIQKKKLAHSVLHGLVDNGSNVASAVNNSHAANKTNSVESVHSIIRTHYVTYASDHTEGLQNLLDSAKMSGVTIEVLGLNTHYEDYSSKTDAYMNYLHSSTGPHTRAGDSSESAEQTFKAVPDDDVVMFMDAYDVLVFPAIVKAAAVLAQSPTPIVFCAERGVYPEMPGPIFYPRGVQSPHQSSYTSNTGDPQVDLGNSADGSESSIESSAFSLKFLNSGCVMGRAGQLKHMMAYAHRYSRTYRDDQLAMVRYHIEHPALVSLDVNNALFATSFKLASAPQDVQIAYDLRLYVGTKNVGLLHCNNHKSSMIYPTVVSNIKHALDKYFQGEEGQLLQQAIRLYAAGLTENATLALQHPIVLKNCTSFGGTNPIRNFLLQRMSLET